MRRTLIALALPLAAILTLGLSACASDPTSAGGMEISADAIILDVRTPQEYEAGHLEGARLLDFNGGEVAESIPNLDSDAEYLIYCKSGNRASKAITLMERAGFTDLTNLGSLKQAAEATGKSIVS